MSDLSDWVPRPEPPAAPMTGRTVTLEPYKPEAHGSALFAAIGGEANAGLWRHLPIGPYLSQKDLVDGLDRHAAEGGWRSFVVIPERDAPLGMMSFMRIRAAVGCLELGAIVLTARLQRTTPATEAVFLTLSRAFDDLGYRRFEWKCDAENAASLRAALRFGFTFEGVFRQDRVQKGRNRDTAWLSIIDQEWPRIRAGFETWLAPENFDQEGRARMSLSEARNRRASGAT